MKSPAQGRNRRILSLAFISALLFCAAAQGEEKSLVVTVKNPAAFTRQNETVSLQWKELRKLLPSLNPMRTTVTDANTKTSLTIQNIDENLDGILDELIFQVSLKPGQSRTFIVGNSTGSGSAGASRVDARFVEPREDYAWENDRIAYRMYGPALAAEVNNGVDVWVKRVRYLIAEKWYMENEGNKSGVDTYHEDRGEGADFFSVGRSLGCGGSGIWRNNKLYQPGVFSTHKAVTNGPLRTVFELTYDGWNVEGERMEEVRRVSLDAGENLSRFAVLYTSSAHPDSIAFACGLVKRKNTSPASSDMNSWISLWGPTNDDAKNGSLGTGVVLPKTYCRGMGEDKDHYLIFGRAKVGETITYYAGAGWTRGGNFSNEKDWNRYLDTFARRLEHPLHVIIGLMTR